MILNIAVTPYDSNNQQLYFLIDNVMTFTTHKTPELRITDNLLWPMGVPLKTSINYESVSLRDVTYVLQQMFS